MILDHVPFFAWDRLEYIGYLMYNEYVTGKYINRQIMMAVPKVILFVHKNGRI